MDSPEIRKVRCFEKLKQLLIEEHCTLETSVTIIGARIADTQVIVIPLTEPVEEVPKS